MILTAIGLMVGYVIGAVAMRVKNRREMQELRREKESIERRMEMWKRSAIKSGFLVGDNAEELV